MATHSFWRISITGVVAGPSSADPGDGNPALAEVVFYDSSGTPISTAGGTASSNASINPFVAGGGAPSAAFDGNTGTSWCSTGTATATSPIYLQMAFPSPVDVDHFSLSFENTQPANCPTDFTLDYSDDGSAWTTQFYYRGGMRVTGLYTNTFYTTGVVYRFSATAIQSGSDRVAFAGLKFFSGASLLTGILGKGFNYNWDGGAMPDGPDPIQAYNNGCSTGFASRDVPSSGSPRWIGFQFPAGTPPPDSLSFQSSSFTNGIADTPTVFSIQQSTDGLNFTTLAAFASVAWTTTCQTQTFSIVAPTRSITASPSIGVQCQSETVTISGRNTHFVNGITTVAMSGTGATVSSVSVSSATSLTFSLALSCSARLGIRTITVTTGLESDTAPFVIVAGPAIASLLQGNIAWAQLRLGFNGRFGTGMYGASTDGTGSAGVIPVWGGPDGETLTAGNTGSLTSAFLNTYIASTPLLDPGGDPIMDANGNWIFPG